MLGGPDQGGHAGVSIRDDLRQGRAIGVPLCCRLLFAIQYALDPDYMQAAHRGIRFNRAGVEFVPCGVFHKPVISHAALQRILDDENDILLTRLRVARR